MTRTSRSSFALLAGAALIIAPGPLLAQSEDVADQTEEVAEKAADLQAATNSLNDELAQQQAAADATNAAVADNDGRDGRNGDADRRDRDGDDDSGKWGWLGLLGLAGLLGLRRRDDHVDHQHDLRPHADRTTADRTRSGNDTSRM